MSGVSELVSKRWGGGGGEYGSVMNNDNKIAMIIMNAFLVH